MADRRPDQAGSRGRDRAEGTSAADGETQEKPAGSRPGQGTQEARPALRAVLSKLREAAAAHDTDLPLPPITPERPSS